VPRPLLLLAAALCPTEPRTPAGLRQAEDHWVAALESRDGAALACRLAADFADSNWQGMVVRRDDMLARLPQRPPSSLHLTDVTVRIEANTGIVRGLNTQVAPDGTVVGRVRFTDIFVWRAGRWQAIAAQETPVAAPHLEQRSLRKRETSGTQKE
jgi:hypothetical protein